jgi:hypothetical protein
MKFREFVVTATAACAIGWVAGSAVPDDKPSADEAAEQAKWVEHATPGEEQSRLGSMAGEWNVHGVFKHGEDVVETDSTASISMILGGRFWQQEAKGDFMGMPFEGRGIIGYNKTSKRYVGAWIDTMGTGIMYSEGQETEKGKVWKFKGKYDGPSGELTSEDTMTRVSDSEMKFESVVAMGGKPMMSMTLQYKRK